MNRFRQGWFWHDRRAMALVEFATLLPLLMFLAFVGFEFVSLQIARIRTDKAAYMIANAISQVSVSDVTHPTASYQTINEQQVRELLEETDHLLPRATRARAKVVVSAFTQVDQLYDAPGAAARGVFAPVMLWAKGKQLDSVPLSELSTIPLLGASVQFARAIQMQKVTFTDRNTDKVPTRYGNFRCGEQILLVEVFYEYEPMFSLYADANLIDRQVFISRAFLRPRGGDIEAIAGDANFGTPDASYLLTKSRNGFCR